MKIPDSAIPEVGGGTATFNQAQFQMIRLHQIMEQINRCWLNLLEVVEGVPAYVLLFESLNAYYLEVKASFTQSERDLVQEQNDKIEHILSVGKLWEHDIYSNIASETNTTKLNMSTFRLLKSELRNFQTLILDYSHGHGLGNPTKPDPGEAIMEKS